MKELILFIRTMVLGFMIAFVFLSCTEKPAKQEIQEEDVIMLDLDKETVPMEEEKPTSFVEYFASDQRNFKNGGAYFGLEMVGPEAVAVDGFKEIPKSFYSRIGVDDTSLRVYYRAKYSHERSFNSYFYMIDRTQGDIVDVDFYMVNFDANEKFIDRIKIATYYDDDHMPEDFKMTGAYVLNREGKMLVKRFKLNKDREEAFTETYIVSEEGKISKLEE